jgi:hypothetical protein
MAVNPQIKNIVLKSTKAPNLLVAPVDYRQEYLDQLTNTLRLYFTQIDNFTQATVNPLSGTTANRPVDDNVQLPLPIGQYYFDTTIGRPIYWNGTNWINAAGTIV